MCVCVCVCVPWPSSAGCAYHSSAASKQAHTHACGVVGGHHVTHTVLRLCLAGRHVDMPYDMDAMMLKTEATALKLEERVVVFEAGTRFICSVKAVDATTGNIKVFFLTWPDEDMAWISHRQIYSSSSLAVKEAYVAMSRLEKFTKSSPTRFRFKIGDRVMIKCGKVARFDATISCRTLRRMKGEDTAQDSISSDFSAAYLVDSIDTEFDAVIGAQDDEFIRETKVTAYPTTNEPAHVRQLPKLPMPSGAQIKAEAVAAKARAEASLFHTMASIP